MTEDQDEKRRWFNGYVTRHGSGVIEPKRDNFWYTCPCCGYPTLPERGGHDICCLCNWEDDGQDDPHAEEVWGGPNYTYSLTEARRNFKRYQVKYRPDNDTRIIPGDSDLTLTAKKTMAQAFDAMIGADDSKQAQLWETISNARVTLDQEVHRRVREYEQQMKKGNSRRF